MKVIIRLIVVFFILTAKVQAESYQFPEMNPGDSHEKRLQSLQIPLGILEEMSANDLAETCMNFPFNVNVLYFNSTEEGIQSILRDFNGYRELLSRPDGPSILLELYQNMDPSEFDVYEQPKSGEKNQSKTYKHAHKKWKSVNMVIVEGLLNNDRIFRRLMKSEKKKLAEETLKKLEQKGTCSKNNTIGCDQNSSAQLALRFLDSEKHQNKKVLDLRQQKDKDWLNQKVRDYINQ